MAERSPEEVKSEREAIMKAIETMAEDIKGEKAWYKWSSSIKDQDVKRLVAGVNGPLALLLAKKAKYHDADCIFLFRDGAPIVGTLAKTGNNKPQVKEAALSVAELRAGRLAKNTELIRYVHACSHCGDEYLVRCP